MNARRKLWRILLPARVVAQDELRPGVETPMHDVLPQTHAVHTHPTMIDGLACAPHAEEHARRLFGNSLVSIPVVNLGYTLGIVARRAVQTSIADLTVRLRSCFFFKAHGLMVAGNILDEIRERHD